jgi:hypothetical protein
LIVQYVLECRGQGLFLPYQDYQVVDEWLRAAGANGMTPDDLLLVLSEALPAFYGAGATANARPRSLAGVKRLVMSRVKDRGMALGAGVPVETFAPKSEGKP